MDDRIVVRASPKGDRGVYSEKWIDEGAIIQDAPVIVFPNGQATVRSIVHRYTFVWGPRHSALAMSALSFANHSYAPNAVYLPMHAKRIIRFRAWRGIEPGEEITINYTGDPNDQSPVGFRVRT